MYESIDAESNRGWHLHVQPNTPEYDGCSLIRYDARWDGALLGCETHRVMKQALFTSS